MTPDDRAPDDIDRIGPWTQLIFLGIGLAIVFFGGRGILRSVGVIDQHQSANVAARPPPSSGLEPIEAQLLIGLTQGEAGGHLLVAASPVGVFIQAEDLYLSVDGSDCASNYRALSPADDPLWMPCALTRKPHATVSQVSALTAHGAWRCTRNIAQSDPLNWTFFDCRLR